MSFSPCLAALLSLSLLAPLRAEGWLGTGSPGAPRPPEVSGSPGSFPPPEAASVPDQEPADLPAPPGPETPREGSPREPVVLPCLSRDLSFPQDATTEDGRSYSSFHPRSAVAMDQGVLVGDRHFEGLRFFAYQDLLGDGPHLPSRSYRLPRTSRLARVELDGRTYLVDGNLFLHTLEEDGTLRRAEELGPRQPLPWTGIVPLPKNPDRLLVTSGKSLILLDLRRRDPLRIHGLGYEPQGVALVGSRILLAEEQGRAVVFHVLRVPLHYRTGVPTGPPDHQSTSDPVQGGLYHLVGALGSAFAGIESSATGRFRRSIVELELYGDRLQPREVGTGNVRLMIGTPERLIAGGGIYRRLERRLALIRTAVVASPDTVDGSPYSGDLRGDLLVLPSLGMKSGSGAMIRCLRQAEDRVESW